MHKAASAQPVTAPVAPLPANWPAMSIEQAHARLTAPGARFEIEELSIRGIRTRVWKNGPRTLRELFLLSRAFADRTFLVYEDDRATFASFARAVVSLAHELEQQGVGKGDRVALVMRNLPEWPVAFFAASLCGAIVTPLNAWWTGPELEYGLTDSGSKVAIVDSERYERIAEHLHACHDLKRVYVARENDDVADPRVIKLERVLGQVNDWGALLDRAPPDVAIEAEDDATIFYTSGTTGKPKGALGTHRNITSNIMTGAAVAARSFLRRGETPPDPAKLPQRVTLLAVPLFHVTGCNASLIPAVFGGGKLVLMRKWDAEKALQLIEREGVTVTGGVPTIAWQLLEHPARKNYNLSTLEAVAYGGAPSAPELVRRIIEDFPKSHAGNGWGMTETSASFSGNSAEDYVNRPASCGPTPAVGAVRIMNADATRELPVGEAGELWVKGPMVVKGYWNNPEATAKTFVDGWLRTGDIARVDEEGFCYIVDRAKDMLIRGGENIYCIEVENVLYEHPAVMDAALVAIPHKILGEEPGAVVQLKPGACASEDELRSWVAERLAAFKVPVKIAFWNETLPRNPAGKILKSELKKVFVPP
ncbi:MAG: long-chain fatty acid--CoA ligase [Lysobacterales bacterium]|nr:MAG: long-chain fatty acid--CoA ligase [Xanthomonadales bacterium]